MYICRVNIMVKIHSYQTKLVTQTDIFQLENWDEIVDKLQTNFSKIVWIIDEKLKSRTEFIGLENSLFIAAGEAAKTQDSYLSIIQYLAENKVDRKSIIVAIGGGSISDLVGYVASTYLRGIAFSIIPTTILSLIDASMGGKNGINFQAIKNQIGTIYQPRIIYYYNPFFDSLSEEEISDGFAEIIKYGLIGDEEFYAFIASHSFEDFKSNHEFRTQIIETCIKQKSKIVEEDTFESGKRRILNFGHTVGHAIESLYGLSHGKSVVLGMLFAVKLSEKINGLSTAVFFDILKTFKKYNLPTQVKNFEIEDIYKKLIQDKKKESDFVHFVLLNEIGDAEVVKINLAEIKSWLEISKKERWI